MWLRVVYKFCKQFQFQIELDFKIWIITKIHHSVSIKSVTILSDSTCKYRTRNGGGGVCEQFNDFVFTRCSVYLICLQN